MSKKDSKEKFLSRTDITDIFEDWTKVKNFFGNKSDSEALRSMVKKLSRMIESGELPP